MTTTPTPDAICKRLLAKSWQDNGDGGNVFVEELTNPDGPEAADLIQQQQATIERLSAEKAELRRIIAELGYCTPDASLEFMRLIPAKVKATKAPQSTLEQEKRG